MKSPFCLLFVVLITSIGCQFNFDLFNENSFDIDEEAESRLLQDMETFLMEYAEEDGVALEKSKVKKQFYILLQVHAKK